MILNKNLIDKYNQHKNNVLEESVVTLQPNVIEDSSKLKTCCFYNDKNRSRTKLQNKVRESGVETFPHHVLEQSSTNYNEISSIKKYFKNRYPYPGCIHCIHPIHLFILFGGIVRK